MTAVAGFIRRRRFLSRSATLVASRGRAERPAASAGEVAPVDIGSNDPLLVYLQSANGVVDIETLELDSPGVTAMRAAGVKLAVPLVNQGELVGVLNLGPRRSEQRRAARRAIERLCLTPVMFELGARPHPPRSLYLAYLRQSHVFVGIYGEQYGWTAPDMGVSGLEDEVRHAVGMPLLLYLKNPAPRRDLRLKALVDDVAETSGASYKSYSSAEELEDLLAGDLAVLLTERFTTPVARPSPRCCRRPRVSLSGHAWSSMI